MTSHNVYICSVLVESVTYIHMCSSLCGEYRSGERMHVTRWALEEVIKVGERNSAIAYVRTYIHEWRKSEELPIHCWNDMKSKPTFVHHLYNLCCRWYLRMFSFPSLKTLKGFRGKSANYVPTNIPAIVYQYSSVLHLLCMLESPLYPLTFTACRFTSTCVPNFDWEDPSFTSVMNLYLGKVTRLFRKLALEPQFHQSTWQRFCNIFIGVNFTLERNPSLALSWRDLIAVSSWDSVKGHIRSPCLCTGCPASEHCPSQ